MNIGKLILVVVLIQNLMEPTVQWMPGSIRSCFKPKDFCSNYPQQTVYSDGCNICVCNSKKWVSCSNRGCPSFHGTRSQFEKYCKILKRNINRVKGEQIQTFTRPCFEAKDVCVDYPQKTHYYDGCNSCTCGSKTSAFCTKLNCPSFRGAKSQFEDYCKKLKNNIKKVKDEQIQTFNRTCFEAKDICFNYPQQIRYYDGCNSCKCETKTSAYCSRRVCPPFRGTKSQFDKRCKKLKNEINKIGNEIIQTFVRPCIQAKDLCFNYPHQTHYYDGCNSCSCLSKNFTYCTYARCPSYRGTKREFEDYCKTLKRKINKVKVEHIQTFTRPCFKAKDVCFNYPQKTRYSDGCNSCTCLSKIFAMCTKLGCLSFRGTKNQFEKYCNTLKRNINNVKEEQIQTFTRQCLYAKDVCFNFPKKIHYYNGCNGCNCLSKTSAGCTKMGCPLFDGTKSQFEEYCRKLKIKANKVEEEHVQIFTRPCFKAKDICFNYPQIIHYFDGCNNCICFSKVSAGCLRMACKPFSGTKSQFKEYCKRLKRNITKVKEEQIQTFTRPCLEAKDACFNFPQNIHYYDGCNGCNCVSKISAGCTKMGCSAFRGTKSQFKEHCRKILQ